MNRYPSASVERIDQQWAETEDERNARLRAKRLKRRQGECPSGTTSEQVAIAPKGSACESPASLVPP